MKHSSRSAKLKPVNSAAKKPQPQSKPRDAKNGFFLPRWALIVLCLLLATGATWATFEYFILSKIPPELVGKWVVTSGPQEGATFDFHRNGSMVGKINMGGSEGIINASVRVEDKKIYSTTKHPATGKSSTSVLTIRTLNATQLVVQDEQGMTMHMTRAE